MRAAIKEERFTPNIAYENGRPSLLGVLNLAQLQVVFFHISLQGGLNHPPQIRGLPGSDPDFRTHLTEPGPDLREGLLRRLHCHIRIHVRPAGTLLRGEKHPHPFFRI